jgi:hypothetical protein
MMRGKRSLRAAALAALILGTGAAVLAQPARAEQRPFFVTGQPGFGLQHAQWLAQQRALYAVGQARLNQQYAIGRAGIAAMQAQALAQQRAAFAAGQARFRATWQPPRWYGTPQWPIANGAPRNTGIEPIAEPGWAQPGWAQPGWAQQPAFYAPPQPAFATPQPPFFAPSQPGFAAPAPWQAQQPAFYGQNQPGYAQWLAQQRVLYAIGQANLRAEYATGQANLAAMQAQALAQQRALYAAGQARFMAQWHQPPLYGTPASPWPISRGAPRFR